MRNTNVKKWVGFDKEKWLSDPNVKEEYTKCKPLWDLKCMLIQGRVDAKMSQKEVAERMGIKAPYISKFESVTHTCPKFDTIVAYARAVGLKEIRIKIDQ